jgi:prokaryotic ubiquitin-like protein Pup
MRHDTKRRLAAHADATCFAVYSASDSTQKQVPRKGDSDEQGKEGGGAQKLAKRGKELKESMDALVDEIDEVLEENAEEFVKNYVQRGGQ